MPKATKRVAARKPCSDPIRMFFGLRKAEMICLGIILLSLAIAVYMYPIMPDKIASHWNAEGQVDGYMGKFWALFIMPIIGVVLFLMFLAIPRIDPLKENIKKFRTYFDAFIVLMFLFLLYLFALTLIWNTGTEFDMIQALAPAFGVLFYYCGILVENAKRNWFIGIRTPWTLSSEIVWDKTHALGGKLFKVAGAIAVLGVFKFYSIWFVIGPVILLTAYVFLYSYLEYQKLPAKKK